MPPGGREADGAPGGRNVCRHVLAGFITRIPSWREGWGEVSSSSTVTQCHSVTRSHQAGKSRITFVLPRAAGAHLLWGTSEQSLGSMALPTTLLEQEMLPQSLSRPVEAVSRAEDGLFTFAETLEWADLNFSVACFNLSVVTWTMPWGEVEKHQKLPVPHPHLVPASFHWFPCRCLQTASPQLGCCPPCVTLVTNPYL